MPQDGNNENFHFNGAGSCFGEGSGSLGPFGGVVYVYNSQQVLLYHPSDSSGGQFVYLGGRWGNGVNSQSSGNGSVIVNVFRFEGNVRICLTIKVLRTLITRIKHLNIHNYKIFQIPNMKNISNTNVHVLVLNI